MSETAALPRPSLLYVTAVAPDFDGIGIEKRAAANVAALTRLFEVDLLVIDLPRYFQNKAIDPRVTRLCRRAALIPAKESRIGRLYYGLASAQLVVLLRMLCPQPIAMVLADARVPALREFLAGRSYDVVHVSRLKVATLLPAILSQLAGKPKRLALDLDDIESDAARRQAAGLRGKVGLQLYLADRADALKFKWLEWRVGRSFDHVYLCSQHDADRFRRLYAPTASVDMVPNIAQHPREAAEPARARSPLTVLYVGNLQYGPNIDGLAFFHDEVLPHLKRMVDVPFRVSVVGRAPAAAVRAIAQQPGFSLVADVPDIAPHFRDADIVIVPLRFGGGTRIKIVEAFSYRRPVVSTTLGAEGIEAEPGKELLIADDPKLFAMHCADLIRGADYRRQIADAGHAVFERRYSQAMLERIFAAIFGPSPGARRRA
jgi:glycosyltransferase involved in cell wall biosynthesis